MAFTRNRQPKKSYKYPSEEKFDYDNNPEYKKEKQKDYRGRHPDRIRDQKYRDTFGITLEEYNRMLRQQNGVCAICFEPETAKRLGKTLRLAVEHCHTTGKVRGLACRRCNSTMGYVKDSSLLLRSMADYLEKHY